MAGTSEEDRNVREGETDVVSATMSQALCSVHRVNHLINLCPHSGREVIVYLQQLHKII